jgi:hypothetical protein
LVNFVRHRLWSTQESLSYQHGLLIELFFASLRRGLPIELMVERLLGIRWGSVAHDLFLKLVLAEDR